MTIKQFNLLLGILGLIIIWFATHSILGLIGGFISGIHLNVSRN